ncbi:MAG: 50S ribosomal protein L29 [Candidatus Zambryskibacteria bacterium]|nr:50S ribosomal protein L29 [Candidatus Zambryskibacteria bacterium]
MKEYKKYKAQATTELKSLLSEKRLALRNFRFAVSGSNVRNVKEGNALKKDIARILTILNTK